VKQRFVSLLLAIWRPDDSAMHIVNAGQSRPLLWREGAVSIVETDGVHFPLGIVDAPRYTATRLPCRPGDIVLLYTDGVSEAMNASKEIFGEERLQASFAELCGQSAAVADIHKALFERVMTYTGAAEQHDDVTMVVIRIDN
jgi:sigma-B regulation protein RsbU (phosphoserine phosphatase)